MKCDKYIFNLLNDRKSDLKRELKYAEYMVESYLEMFKEDESEREQNENDFKMYQENIVEYEKEINFIEELLPSYNSL